MAELVQITLFTFDELPEESQQKLIEGFRQDYDPDYSHIYYDFINDMSEQYGADISVDDIQWSGFWSQGDGACFTCDFDKEVIFPILKEGLHEEDVASLKGFELSQAKSVRCGPSNFYSHENTVTGDIWLDRPNDDAELSGNIHQYLEDALTAIIRDSCQDLYRRLEEEYDHATSDEAIIEEIKNIWPGCNFRKDGTIFAR